MAADGQGAARALQAGITCPVLMGILSPDLAPTYLLLVHSSAISPPLPFQPTAVLSAVYTLLELKLKLSQRCLTFTKKSLGEGP